MSQHRTTVSLRHMLDHALEAVTLTKGKTRADLDKDRELNLALVRLLEIIGEAASRIPKRRPGSPRRYFMVRDNQFAQPPHSRL